MSRNGSGTYTLPSGNPVVTNTIISSTWANNTLSDIATALTQSLAYDGQTTPVANLSMGGFRLTSLGNGTTSTDAATIGQVQGGLTSYVSTVGGTSDVITLSPSPAIGAYAAGQVFSFISSGANTTNVTVAVSGLAAKAVTRNGATALVANDIPASAIVEMEYDGTRFQILSINPFATINTWAAAQTFSNTVGMNGLVTMAAAVNDNKGTNVSSATSTPIGAATGKVIDVTGTTTITSFDTIQAGTIRLVRFTGILTLTNNASSLILPGGANITTANGDTALFVSLGSGNWYCALYQPAASVIPGLATQANQETSTSLSTYVSPGRQQYHPSASKFWAKYDTSTTSLAASYNCTSITRGGTGDTTVNYTVAFSGTDYCVLTTPQIAAATAGSAAKTWTIKTLNTGSVRLISTDGSTGADSVLCVAGFGDQ